MEPNDAPPPLRWPKFALLAVIAFLLLAVLWVSVLVKRTRDQNAWNPMPGQSSTNTRAPW